MLFARVRDRESDANKQCFACAKQIELAFRFIVANDFFFIIGNDFVLLSLHGCTSCGCIKPLIQRRIAKEMWKEIFFLLQKKCEKTSHKLFSIYCCCFLWNTHNSLAHTPWGFHTFRTHVLYFFLLIPILNSNAFYVWLLTGSNKYRKLVGTLEYFRYLNSIGNGCTCATCHTIYFKLQPEIVCLFVLSSRVCVCAIFLASFSYTHTHIPIRNASNARGKILFTVQIDIALLMNDVSILTFIHR